MKKGIGDRALLGVYAGLAGAVAKSSVNTLFRKRKMSEVGYGSMAASLFVDHKRSANSQILGYAADGLIGMAMGIPLTYALSVTGRDKALLKGAVYGGFAWVGLLGALQNIGLTSVSPDRAKSNLMELISHIAYGTVAAAVVRGLGSEALFVDSKDKTDVKEYAVRRSMGLYSEPVLDDTGRNFDGQGGYRPR